MNFNNQGYMTRGFEETNETKNTDSTVITNKTVESVKIQNII